MTEFEDVLLKALDTFEKVSIKALEVESDQHNAAMRASIRKTVERQIAASIHKYRETETTASNDAPLREWEQRILDSNYTKDKP